MKMLSEANESGAYTLRADGGEDAEKIILYRKIGWRVLPFLMICYMFAYLDRINIGFAMLQMRTDIGLGDTAYGLGAGIFFLGYAMFEIPSNLLLPKVGARKTLSRIMILWGLTSASMVFVHSEHLFYAVRFLLGVFEAGFAPGMIFYLTYWYPKERMAQVIAIVMCASPIGGILGGPLSTWVMTTFAGMHGLAGWQWMFLLEGMPCVVLGVLALWYMDDRPDGARWLSERQKNLLSGDLAVPRSHHHSFRQVLADPRVIMLALAYFCIICGIYAVSFWLPTILKGAGLRSMLQIGVCSALPYVAAIVGMIYFGRRSDRRGERRWHSALTALGGAVGLTVAALHPGDLSISLISITVATGLMWGAYAVFWAMPSGYVKGDTAAGGIAYINTIGLLGGFVSPFVMGWIKDLTGTMVSGLLLMVGLLIAGALLIIVNRLPADPVQ
ncbi:MFS transporter [Paraburkholderia ferrariae]|uniref:MFS transporter n=1 Tax=Paraburkholderia ferrariae TaxID=386056 RepID=UPI001FE15FD4|nr:MFS transporter [Paraburkholderia ferrariae]